MKLLPLLYITQLFLSQEKYNEKIMENKNKNNVEQIFCDISDTQQLFFGFTLIMTYDGGYLYPGKNYYPERTEIDYKEIGGTHWSVEG